ncbi:hypothetical protein [Aureliella helgolandensis]|uniref:Uncharacterized protein n=1 Tax=Aureliella helgolandensis TaxID=2527968 RepID=A0A518G7W2_9BACT|nr:hypothetical protein [Aureliella helgolandensis]QDV24677.1 hypothetical protein Q31a_29980 [Aureliella helgolandensis]
MSSIPSINSSAASQVQQGASSRPSRGGNPGERLNSDLTSFLKQEGVSSEGQQKIKSEFSDALESLASTGTQVSSSQVKETLSKVLESNGLDGDSFVSGLGSPQAKNGGAAQAGQGKRPHGGGPPGGGPPPQSTEATSSSSETSYLEDLLEALAESSSSSNESSTSQSQSNVFPGNYINRSGGNLDAQV